MDQKKYGLIRLSKTDKTKTTLKKNIFDSDSDEESQSNPKINTSSGIRRQTQLDISRALSDDPNVFEYDSIYEDMKSQKESIVAIDSQTKDKPKPKYINNLLKYSENRKKENERRIERKIQKEREKEGNQFEDKEQFVTNAYKEKLNEMKAAEERDLKEQAIEELLDVKKQKDLSGFYRHLLNNDISSEKKDLITESVDIKPKDVIQEIPNQKSKPIPKPKTNRQFRRRRTSSEDSSDDSLQKRDIKIDNKEKTEKNPIIKESEECLQNESEDKESNIKNSIKKTALDSNAENKEINIRDENYVQNKESPEEETNKIPKLDKREVLLKIFTKRTVGETFTEAQMRYFQRKDNYVI